MLLSFLVVRHRSSAGGRSFAKRSAIRDLCCSNRPSGRPPKWGGQNKYSVEFLEPDQHRHQKGPLSKSKGTTNHHAGWKGASTRRPYSGLCLKVATLRSSCQSSMSWPSTSFFAHSFAASSSRHSTSMARIMWSSSLMRYARYSTIDPHFYGARGASVHALSDVNSN
jgi:hypothetical protein